MATYQVTCISRDGPDPDYRIDAIGFNGEVYDLDATIQWLRDSPENKLYVVADRKSVWVGIRQHPQSGRYFLATEPDGYALNNLAELKECP